MEEVELKKIKPGDIFPKDPNKSYGLMELMRGTSTVVGKGGEPDAVMSWPYLVILETIAVLGVTVFLLAWALLWNAPLQDLANPDVTENPAKAPWYFLNLQELLLHMHPSLAGVLVPTALIIALLILPYVDRDPRDVGTWFASKRGQAVAIFGALWAAVWVPILIVFDEYFPIKAVFKDIGDQLVVGIPQPFDVVVLEFVAQIIPGWIIPVIIMAVLIALQVLLMQSFWKPTLREALIGIFTAFVVTTVALTISGTIFRGEGFRLKFPTEVLREGLGIYAGPLVGIILAAILVWLIARIQQRGVE